MPRARQQRNAKRNNATQTHAMSCTQAMEHSTTRALKQLNKRKSVCVQGAPRCRRAAAAGRQNPNGGTPEARQNAARARAEAPGGFENTLYTNNQADVSIMSRRKYQEHRMFHNTLQAHSIEHNMFDPNSHDTYCLQQRLGCTRSPQATRDVLTHIHNTFLPE